MLLHVGYRNYVNKAKVLAITEAKSQPMLRVRRNMEVDNKVIDCTENRKTISLVHLEGGYIVLSAISTEALLARFTENRI